jgi:hypothetical protein
LKDGTKVDCIRKQQWYFSEYDLDPSIQSMIKALSIIESKIEDWVKKTDNCRLSSFSEFLLEKINFFYFDMKNRQHGEEMFVVINTTGLPLTATENLKPLLIGNILDTNEREKSSKVWEKWEKWFWQNKLENEAEADEGFNDFFVWYWQIKIGQENVVPITLFRKEPKGLDKEAWEKIVSIPEIDRYFEQYKILDKYVEDLNFKRLLNQKKGINSPREYVKQLQLSVALPLLEFMVKFPGDMEKHRLFFRRIRKNYFDGDRKGNREPNYVDWRHILEIIEKGDDAASVLKFKGGSDEFRQIGNVKSHPENWYNNNEERKDILRVNYKDLIEEWEDHEDIMGDLGPLFEVAGATPEVAGLESLFNTYKRVRDYKMSRKIKDSIPNSNTELLNTYRLYLYVKWGADDHRGVAGWGYCMRKNYNGILYEQKEFLKLWVLFNTKPDIEVIGSMKEELRSLFKTKVLKRTGEDVEKMVANPVQYIGTSETIRLWAFLEYLLIENKKELDFSKSIACFWEFPNLVQITENRNHQNNNYELGNLKLGWSKKNNRWGWVQYDTYPLMKSLNKEKDLTVQDIEAKTKKYKSKINAFLNEGL